MTRASICDVCDTVRPNCQWVERSDSGNRYFACPDCRAYWRLLGRLKDLDVMAGEPLTEVKKD